MPIVQGMSREKSLDAILGSFDPNEETGRANLKGGTVTIWLSPEYKAKYDRIQERSQRRFVKKLRELVQAAIDRTEQVA